MFPYTPNSYDACTDESPISGSVPSCTSKKLIKPQLAIILYYVQLSAGMACLHEDEANYTAACKKELVYTEYVLKY